MFETGSIDQLFSAGLRVAQDGFFVDQRATLFFEDDSTADNGVGDIRR